MACIRRFKKFQTINLKECLEDLKRKNKNKIFIIGGRSIYKLFFHLADYLHISFVNIVNNDINEFFPFDIDDIKNNFNKIDEKILSNEAKYTYWVKL